MSNAIVSNVYRYVIDDVINQVRGDFEDMGIDESILQELQRSWESKIARSRVANFGFKDDEYYEDERGTNMNTILGDGQLHYPSEYSNNGHPNTGHPPANNLANLAAQGIHNNRLLPQMQPPYGIPPINGHNRAIPDQNALLSQYQMMQNPQNNNNSNTLPELQLPRPNIPQNDGANDMTTQEIDRHIEDIIQSSSQQEDQIVFTASSFSGEPLALESLPDHVKQLMKDARERAIKAGALSKNRRIPQLDGSDDIKEEVTDEQPEKNDDDINSDLDDTDEEGEDGEGGEEIEHIILCLYDKVSRTKNKWKCTLKDGIMLINGRDYLFARANGDFEW